MLSAICFNLDQSKTLSSSNGLSPVCPVQKRNSNKDQSMFSEDMLPVDSIACLVQKATPRRPTKID